jgi:hypothetical protein
MSALYAGKQKPVVNESLAFEYVCSTETISMSGSEIMPNPFDRYRFRLPIAMDCSPSRWVIKRQLTNCIVDLAADFIFV